MSKKTNNILVLMGLSILAFTGYLDATIISTALPSIQHALKMPVHQLQWVMNAFFIGLSACMLIMSNVADNLGRKKVFIIGTVIFGIASIGAGLSPSPAWLIFFRAIQGITTAITIPVAILNVFHIFPEQQVAKAMSVFSAITGAGLALGPLVGGLLVSWFNWRAIFFVNVPFVIVGLLLCLSLKESRSSEPKPIDFLGMIFLAITIVAFTFSIVQIQQYGWGASIVITGFVITLVALISLITVEMRCKHPILSLKVLKTPVLLSCVIFAACGGGMMTIILFIMPLYLHGILGFSTVDTGLLLFIMPVMVILSSYFLGHFVSKYGTKQLLIIGAICYMAVCLLQLLFSIHINYTIIIVTFILFGFAWGLYNLVPSIAVTKSVEGDANGIALGMLYSSYNIGAAVTLAVAVSLFSWRIIDAIEHGAHYSKHQIQLLHQFVSQPEKIHLIAQQLPSITNIENKLAHAFTQGMHIMFWLPLLLALISCVLFIRLKRTK